MLCGMEKTDARKLTSEQLTEVRRRAVAAVQRGESPSETARVFGVSKAAVFNWIALYRQGGWDALDAKKRGGRKPKLDAGAMQWIYRTVTLGNPDQLKMPFVLWSAKLLAAAIKSKFGVPPSRASVCRLPHQLGLSPQRPLWRAYQRDPAAVERWLKKRYPAIKAAARKAGAQIWFGDEAGARSGAHSGTTWAPAGETPVVPATGARFGLNVLSAVSSRGEFRFMCAAGTINADVFIEFLKRLVAGTDRPVVLVVDGHSAHKALKTRAFVKSLKGRLRLHLLPAYSPDLNPGELVWNNLKRQGTGNRVVTGPDQLKALALSHLRSMQKRPGLIRSFYKAPSTEYAA